MNRVATSLAQQPFALLRELEARSRRHARGLPQQVEVRRPWSGIAFRVSGVLLVSGIAEINEILDYPQMTRVPGAHAWVRGLANIRGTLLPILDLAGFIGDRLITPGRDTRILAVQQGGVSAGLVVDEVVGLRHFFEEERSDELPEAPDGMRGYLDGAYRHASGHWGVFSMARLAADPRFLQVAAHG